jgi:outer membrane protein OmpA-like peptidoglycan-associated protein
MTILRVIVVACLLSLVPLAPAFANATIPTKDIPGARDNALAKRYEGSFIVSYNQQAFTNFSVPLSKLERVEGQKDRSNNIVYKPKQASEVEGSRTRIAYLLPAERSPLEVLRNYQDVVKSAGGEVLFECKTDECGGDPLRSSSGGGGNQSLMMYFFYASDLKEEPFSNGSCALTSRISDQRFFAAKIPQNGGDAYVTVQTYLTNDSNYCKAFNDRTIALVHVLEPKPRDQKMVLVKSDEMAQSINSSGRIALYGLLFDTDKADLKPESAPTMEEIAKLINGNPKLVVLIVGHSDNQGAYDYNVDLSKRRAQTVASTLAKSYKVDPKRMHSTGIGMSAPAATNDTEEGRAKNRRVEVVKFN